MIPLQGDVNMMMGQVSMEARRKGVQFSGTLPSGSFSGMGVSGRYIVNGNQVTITIDEKPIYYPCNMIENIVRDWFSQL
jgi:hypothetical protein